MLKALTIQPDHEFFIKGFLNIVRNDDSVTDYFRLIG
jgi:hypothetical protein